MPFIAKALATQDPFRLLAAMESHYLSLPTKVSDIGPLRQQVRMIEFRTGPLYCLVTMDEVLEILLYPELTRIPNARSWLKGVANMRGNLLPVMDLHGFLTGNLTPLSRAQRVLVIQQAGRYMGLLVDELFAIRRFYTDTLQTKTSGIDERYAAYVDGSYVDEKTGQRWSVFSISRFIANPLINRA